MASPFRDPPDEPVTEIEEQWARAHCQAFGSSPDKVIGKPARPRWRSWISYARLSIQAAATVGA